MPLYLHYTKERAKRLLKELKKRGYEAEMPIWEYSEILSDTVLDVIRIKGKRIELFKTVRDKKIKYKQYYKIKRINEIIKEVEE